MTADHVVVVGAGLGGLRTIESLRQRGYAGEITLIGGETHLPYDRPPLTKQVLRGEREQPWLRPEYESLAFTSVLARRVTALDSTARVLTLDDGTAISYDVAVLAPGAQARRLPGSARHAGVHVVRTIEDAVALREAILADRAVAVVGGGFVGCEVAASARAMGAEVTLIEGLAAPLVRIVGSAAAAEVVRLHEANGVQVLCGTVVTEVEGQERVEALVLSDGQRLAVRTVVLGLGVVPDIDWLAGSGVEVGDGIVCTAGGRTSAAGVYAVGDAASWWHPLAGTHRRVEHWTSAADQADVVAANIIAGGGTDPVGATDAVSLSEVPYFWSDQYDVKLQALGFIDAGADIEHFEPNGRSVYVYSRDDRVIGVLGLSAGRSVMRLRSLIGAGAPLADVRDQFAG